MIQKAVQSHFPTIRIQFLFEMTLRSRKDSMSSMTTLRIYWVAQDQPCKWPCQKRTQYCFQIVQLVISWKLQTEHLNWSKNLNLKMHLLFRSNMTGKAHDFIINLAFSCRRFIFETILYHPRFTSLLRSPLLLALCNSAFTETILEPPGESLEVSAASSTSGPAALSLGSPVVCINMRWLSWIEIHQYICACVLKDIRRHHKSTSGYDRQSDHNVCTRCASCCGAYRSLPYPYLQPEREMSFMYSRIHRLRVRAQVSKILFRIKQETQHRHRACITSRVIKLGNLHETLLRF